MFRIVKGLDSKALSSCLTGPTKQVVDLTFGNPEDQKGEDYLWMFLQDTEVPGNEDYP